MQFRKDCEIKDCQVMGILARPNQKHTQGLKITRIFTFQAIIRKMKHLTRLDD